RRPGARGAGTAPGRDVPSRTDQRSARSRPVSGQIVTPDSRKRVLFLCIGNCCRSQMAEGFARTHGSDVLIAASAGIVPTAEVAQDTRRAMAEKHIDLS